MFTQWVTSYFQHGDLSTGDTDVLSFIVPSIHRAPSIYNMSAAEIAEIVDEGVPEVSSLFTLQAQELANYRKACFDKNIREKLPKMKITMFTGDATSSFSIAAYWQMQEDDKAHGGGLIHFRLISGANHFVCILLTYITRNLTDHYGPFRSTGMSQRKPCRFMLTL